MNKKQLLSAIAVLATALNKNVATKDLEVTDLELLHASLTSEKEALDQELEKAKETFKKQDQVVLQFKGPYKRYSNGDIAGFNADVAESILALKPVVAVKHQAEE